MDRFTALVLFSVKACTGCSVPGAKCHQSPGNYHGDNGHNYRELKIENSPGRDHRTQAQWVQSQWSHIVRGKTIGGYRATLQSDMIKWALNFLSVLDVAVIFGVLKSLSDNVCSSQCSVGLV